jgi:hypothetical protein
MGLLNSFLSSMSSLTRRVKLRWDNMSHYSKPLVAVNCGSYALLEMTSNVCPYYSISVQCSHFVVPPHGQDDLRNLESIFEVAHLKKSLTFLDTQCVYRITLMRSTQLANLALRSYAFSNWRFHISTGLRWPTPVILRTCCPFGRHCLPLCRCEWIRATGRRWKEFMRECGTLVVE